ncbi:hypothetical protein BSLA_01f1844 [Burkholderia stabilis]|nr:hypothetical protein BSLA_01f1844 [Burkholderia stabilis]
MRRRSLHGSEVGCGHRVCRGTAEIRRETAILAGARGGEAGGAAERAPERAGPRKRRARCCRCIAARILRAKKTGADTAPEQQRQEENGDAPATPAAYRKY